MYYGTNIDLPDSISIHDFLLDLGKLDRDFLDSYYDILSRVKFEPYVDERPLHWLAEAVVFIDRDGKSAAEAFTAAKEGLARYFAQ